MLVRLLLLNIIIRRCRKTAFTCSPCIIIISYFYTRRLVDDDGGGSGDIAERM